MEAKTKYEDFIGETITETLYTNSLFVYNSASDVLKDELRIRIKRELTYMNGLLCRFEKVTVINTEDNKVIISGIVSQCEVDC